MKLASGLSLSDNSATHTPVAAAGGDSKKKQDKKDKQSKEKENPRQQHVASSVKKVSESKEEADDEAVEEEVAAAGMCFCHVFVSMIKILSTYVLGRVSIFERQIHKAQVLQRTRILSRNTGQNTASNKQSRCVLICWF